MMKIRILIMLLSFTFSFFSCIKGHERIEEISNHDANIKHKKNSIDYESKLYRVKIDRFYGVINEKDQLIIPPVYDYIGYSGEGLIRVCKNNKWGYFNKRGKKVTTLKYDFATNFSQGLSTVKVKDKWAFIDDLGKEKSAFKYGGTMDEFDFCDDTENLFSFVDGMMPIEVDGKYGYVDTHGNEVIAPQYESAGNFNEDLALVTKNGITALINKQGSTVIKLPLKYELRHVFENGLARINLKVDSEEDSFSLKTGYIDKTGKTIIPVEYEFINFHDHRDGCYFQDHSGFSEGIANLCLIENGKWGFIDKNGKKITSFKYDDAGSFEEGMAPVAKGYEFDRKWGFIDKTGKEVIPIKYSFKLPANPNDFLAPSFSEGIAIVLYNGRYGGIDNKGKEIIPFKYSYVSNFSNSIAEVGLNGRYGYINKLNQVIVPIIYDYVWEINDLFGVRLNGKCGVLDSKGNKILSLKYDWIVRSGNNFKVEINKKCGIISKNGEIISPKYDEIEAAPFPLFSLY